MPSFPRALRVTIALVVALLCAALGASLALNPALGSGSASSPSCKGFKNRIGMTSTTITLGNAVDVSGPFPGVDVGAEQGAQAYVRYFNATGQRICGRKLVYKKYDSQTTAAGDKKAYQKMCTQVFAAIGSDSSYDNGGASVAQGCGLPDLRTQARTSARIACSTCFGVDAGWTGEVPNAVPDYFLASHQAATQKAGLVYLNVPSTKATALAEQKVNQQRGYTYVYSGGIDVAEYNYGLYVGKLKSSHAALVEFVGPPDAAFRFAQAMHDAAYSPEVFLVDGVAYDVGVTAISDVTNGVVTSINYLPLTATSNTELNRYRTWLAKVQPGAKVSPEGLYAWSAAKLFVAKAKALGGKLSRASLVAQLRTVRGWTGGGMHVPQNVGTEHASPCVRFLSLHDGKWISVGGTTYRCNGITRAS